MRVIQGRHRRRPRWSSTLAAKLYQHISHGFQLISITFHVLTLTSLTSMARTAVPRPTLLADAATITMAAAHPLWAHVNKTCLSRSCNDTLNEQHLEQLERNIDWTVNACDDFHTYACGNWVPPSGPNTSASMMQVAEESLTARYVEFFERALNGRRADASVLAAATRARQRQQLRRARIRSAHGARTPPLHATYRKRKQLEAPVHAEEVPGDVYAARTEAEDYELILSKLLQYYRVCTHTAPLTLRGYYEQLRMDGVLRSRHNWQEMLAHFARYGYGEQFVYFSVRQENATHHDLFVLPHDGHKRLNLTEEIYDLLRAHTSKSHAELAAEFRALEADLEAIVGSMCAVNGEGKNSTLRSATPAPGVVADEPLLPDDQTSIPISSEEDCDLVETLTFAELTVRCSEVDWQRFIGVPLGRHLHAADRIRVDSPETVCKLALYHNQTPASINFLYSLARFLGYLQQQQHNPLSNGRSGATCIRHMRKLLPVAMSYAYDRFYYAPVRAESDRIIRSIFAQLKAEFARTLALNRMKFEADIVAYMQQKLSSLRLNLGNMPPAVNSSFYVDLIWQLNVSSDNFYRNHLHALAHTYGHLRRLAASATKNHSRSAWYTFNYHAPTFLDSLDSTPYYFCLSNMIIVPHAYLQTPFYDRQFWPILLYGDLANTLGHELIHSFDSTFLEYDHAGNMNELMIKRIESNVNFARNVQCLSQGTKFLSERIADVSGTRLALNSFLRDAQFLRSHGRLFFLQFAQFFCSNTDEATHQQLDAWHDPDAVRLNYTLAQMPEFLEAFDCPAKSRMKAVQRCEMW
ncbi:PREDICTED: uncharacterized protein LOC108366952 [Rhagoletis zephyria]|uniref:uncharacterized protein LOC108366952 n=1 Tax=Rhagoletis zephyria TaxID=28612 RepID=UPI00081140AC|nr:PREDICTED: uncharacterized protein LOC108366952 [Rhagoletis zephyria]